MKPGLAPKALHRHGLQLLVWRPHDDFASSMSGGTGTGIPCPRCKALAEQAQGAAAVPTKCLVVHEKQTRYLRVCLGHRRSILMLGCVYKCESCSKGEFCMTAAGLALAAVHCSTTISKLMLQVCASGSTLMHYRAFTFCGFLTWFSA